MAVRQKKLLSMMGMGDSVLEINKILPEYTAMITDLAVGYESGISENYGAKFDYRLIEGGLVIQSGGCWAYGYAGFNRNDVRIDLTSSGGTRYVYVYVEFDMTGAAVAGATVDACQLMVFDNGSSTVFTYQQDNLREMKTGKYQLPLYRVTVTESGITSDSITDLRVLRRKVKNAENADNAVAVQTEVRGTAVIKSGATLESGVFAATQAKGNRSRNAATTEFVMAAIDDVKNIMSASVTVAGVAAGATIKRQVNFVYLQGECAIPANRFRDYFAENKVVCTIPQAYRPKTRFFTFGRLTQGETAFEVVGLYVNPDGTVTPFAWYASAFNPAQSANFAWNFGYEITEG